MKDKALRNLLEHPNSRSLWRIRKLELIIEGLLKREKLVALEEPLSDKVTLREACKICGG